MKDQVLEIVAAREGVDMKFNVMREYLQAYILRILHDDGFFRTGAFVGGTALRFLHDLPRYSEDLDFSQAREGASEGFAALTQKIGRELAAAGYRAEVAPKTDRAVHSATIKFEGLLKEAGLSPMASQKFSVKLEIDTRPPQGAVLETRVVNKYFPISFLAYDVSSLFAGKVHALLSRKYPKGRDYFDLGWYISRWKDLVPNFGQLNNALKQTGWQGEAMTTENWRGLVAGVVERVDWKQVRRDVEKFLENPRDMDVLNQDNILGMLRSDFRK
jgi:hypothetical protein